MNRRQVLAALSFASAGLSACATAVSARTASPTPPAPAPSKPEAASAVAAAPPRPPVPLATPALPMTVLASGLQFPEGPLVMKDGSLLFVEIQRKTISRLTPNNKVEVFAELEGGPNGLAIGPDGALYVANNGGRWNFVQRDGINTPSGPIPESHKGGWIERIDLQTRKLTRLYDNYRGQPLIAPDDLVFDAKGGMWITEFGRKNGEGALYYATADGRSIVLARSGLNAPNGIGVSPNGKLLHVTMGQWLYTYDIVGPGVLATTSYPDEGRNMPLHDGSIADSLKVMADGRVAACSLIRPGGITILGDKRPEEFYGFPDRFVCNLAFGGADMRDCWLCFSGLGQIAKVRWPLPGMRAPFSA